MKKPRLTSQVKEEQRSESSSIPNNGGVKQHLGNTRGRSKRLDTIRKDPLAARHRIIDELAERNKRIEEMNKKYRKYVEILHHSSETLEDLFQRLCIQTEDSCVIKSSDMAKISSCLKHSVKYLLKMREDIEQVRLLGTKAETQAEQDVDDFKTMMIRAIEIKRNETSGCDPTKEGNWLLSRDFPRQ